MWKKIRYVLYFTVLVFIFSVTYNFREYYYVPYIKIDRSNVKEYIEE